MADAVGFDAVGPDTVDVVSKVGFAWIDVVDFGTDTVGVDAFVDAGVVVLFGIKIRALGDSWCGTLILGIAVLQCLNAI